MLTLEEREMLVIPLGGYPPEVEMSRRLFPDDAYLQMEWLRAVQIVRSTKRGWILDQRVERKAA